MSSSDTEVRFEMSFEMMMGSEDGEDAEDSPTTIAASNAGSSDTETAAETGIHNWPIPTSSPAGRGPRSGPTPDMVAAAMALQALSAGEARPDAAAAARRAAATRELWTCYVDGVTREAAATALWEYCMAIAGYEEQVGPGSVQLVPVQLVARTGHRPAGFGTFGVQLAVAALQRVTRLRLLAVLQALWDRLPLRPWLATRRLTIGDVTVGGRGGVIRSLCEVPNARLAGELWALAEERDRVTAIRGDEVLNTGSGYVVSVIVMD